MASRTYPRPLTLVLILVACSGWVVAWNTSRQPAATTETKTKDATRESRTGRSREGRNASPTGVVKDSATARILASLAEIDSAAEPGKANDKLIQACRGALTDGNRERRERNYSLLLQLMRPEDAPALHELFLDLHREGRTFDEYKTFAIRWGEVDAPGAMKYLTNQVPVRLPRDDFRAIARGWGQTDPAAALSWMNDNPQLSEKLGGKSALIQGWIREDAASALKWLDANKDSLPPRDYFESIQAAFSEQIVGSSTGVTDAVKWLSSLPEDGMSADAAGFAWQSIAWSFSEMPYDQAANVWAQVGDKPWMDFDQFAGFSHASANSRVADQGMEGFLTALEKTWPAEKVTGQFTRWSLQNSDQTAKWLEAAPPSAVTTAAIKGMVKALEQTNPDAAAIWAAKLKE